MKHTVLEIPGVLVLEPCIYTDHRGQFFESFNEREFERVAGCTDRFVQDNHSISSYGVLRGLHFQRSPMAQGKLVRVARGEIFDVAVDIRPDSTTLGQWCGRVLSAENKEQLWVPEGFAHGFLTLSRTAEVLYKATNHYSPESEGCIRWDDPALDIAWPKVDEIVVSEKDQDGGCFDEAIVSLPSL